MAATENACAVDTLSLAWLALLGVLGATTRQPVVVLVAAAMATALLVSARSAARGRAMELVHDVLPALVVLGSYLAIGPVIEVLHRRTWDALLASVDARAFGGVAARWRGLLGQPTWLVDAASVAYLAFYALPIAIAIALRARRRRADLDEFVLRVVATFFISFLGYLLFPALGPRPSADTARSVMGGGAIGEGLRTFLALFDRTGRDAFPSGHAAVVAVCAARAPRLFPRAWPLVLAVALGTVFSTLYLHLHYVSDVVAGLGIAFIVGAVAPALGRLCRAAPRLETGSPGAGVVPLFARSDGDLVRGEAAVRRIMPYLMRGRNESIVLHDATYEISRASRWLEAHNQVAARHATMFDLFLCAIARTLHARPGLNRFISGGHLYQRRGVFVSFAAKTAFEDDAPFVTVKIEIPDGEPFATSVERIAAAVDRARGGGGGFVDRELKLAIALPGFLLRVVMALLRVVDRLNLMPPGMIAADPMYTSVFAANLGSLGLSHTSHHLYEYGTASAFAAMGRAGEAAVDIHWSFDERTNDGFYCASALALMKELMEDPETHFGPPESRVQP